MTRVGWHTRSGSVVVGNGAVIRVQDNAIAAIRPLLEVLHKLPDPCAEPFICPLNDYRIVQPGREVAGPY